MGRIGRVSFKDESEAEILAEDIVPIEDISALAKNRSYGRGGDYYAPAPYDDRQYAGSQREPQNHAASQQTGTARAAAPVNDPVKLRIPQQVLDSHGGGRKLLMHITDMISLYPGGRDVLVYLPGQKPVRCNADKRVTFTDDLKAKLVRLLGEENVKG